MALARAFASFRQKVVSHVRIPVNPALLVAPVAGSCLGALRSFADSTYLDKQEVTDRILFIIKNFDNVKNPEKVSVLAWSLFDV
jgi:hypothetical protein